MPDHGLTEQQRKWMASVKASLEKSTGRSIADWVAVARTCPETAPRAKQRWFKETHGLGQNYAMMVLMAAAEAEGAPLRDPEALKAALWADPGAAAIHAAIDRVAAALPDPVAGQRKGYNTWSRKFAYAAARPVRDGAVRLGLAVEPAADPRLIPAAKEGWPERLKSVLVLRDPAEVDEGVRSLMRRAWEAS